MKTQTLLLAAFGFLGATTAVQYPQEPAELEARGRYQNMNGRHYPRTEIAPFLEARGRSNQQTRRGPHRARATRSPAEGFDRPLVHQVSEFAAHPTSIDREEGFDRPLVHQVSEFAAHPTSIDREEGFDSPLVHQVSEFAAHSTSIDREEGFDSPFVHPRSEYDPHPTAIVRRSPAEKSQQHPRAIAAPEEEY